MEIIGSLGLIGFIFVAFLTILWIILPFTVSNILKESKKHTELLKIQTKALINLNDKMDNDLLSDSSHDDIENEVQNFLKKK